jgi:ubiquinone biosynthesis UbiH/UbiF/VisC/COQ6 family hydroxylase
MPEHPRSAAEPHDVLVRGDGAVGLAAALALAHQGRRVALLGTAARNARGPDLRAWALNAASVALLRSLKVWDALPAAARTPVHDMHVAGDDGAAALSFSAWKQGVAELAWIVDAGALEAALAAAAAFAPGLQRVQGAVPAALTVLAEGRDATSRAERGVQWQSLPYGQQAIAARLASSEAHGNLARQWFRSPDVLALLPLDTPAAGHGHGLVWSLPEARAQALLALDTPAFEAELMAATGGAAGPLRLVSERVAWPLALGQASSVHGAGWVLVGDAAHVVHPLAGQGLNLGLADVAALVALLAERDRDEPWRPLGDERLLGRWARERRLPNQAMASLTDGLLHLFAHPSPWVRSLRNHGLALVDRIAPLKSRLTAQALGLRH